MSIRKRTKKDGTTVYDVTLYYGLRPDGTQERRSITYQTLKEAKDADNAAKRFREAVKEKTGRMTVKEYIERIYWPIASRRLEATTLETYRREIDNRILPILGNVMLTDLSRLKIQAMVDYSKTESVARKSLGLLKTILNEAMGDGLIDANPALARYAMPIKGGKRDNGLYLTDFDQIGEYIGVVLDDAPEAITRLVMTGLLLGLRPEERYALNHEDFDFAHHCVIVRGAYVTASEAFGGNQVKKPKTELSNRVIPMPQAFSDWFYWTRNGKGAWIVNCYGQRLSPSTGRKKWNRYLDAHPELPRITLENMRHSFATACLHAGMNVEDLSRILGHADINTTFRRYVKPDLTNLKRGMALIPYEE